MKLAESAAPEPLQPALGAINCIVGEETVSRSADVATKGGATQNALTKLTMGIGQAIAQLALEDPKGTLEIQLTTLRTPDDANGIATLRWRVDVWKARQRQFVRVPMRELKFGQLVEIDATTLGKYACIHCGQLGALPQCFTTAKLPKKTTVNCARCTLPIHLLLVDAEGKKEGKANG